jgi:transcriptional regulator with GAF, ATPase, and Fis domain
VLDCGTISEALVASELFGHERGAYTDAHERRRGRLEVAASGGTIFMDEIGNLCTAGQRALLRALEERVIYRIGSTTPIPLDMRLITATNDILVDDDEASAFRPDLFYRRCVSGRKMSSSWQAVFSVRVKGSIRLMRANLHRMP